MSDLTEKKELILQSYAETFDRTMAYARVGLTDEEIGELDLDEDFQFRLSLRLIAERESILRRLRNLSESGDEKISFRATIELGKILYPEAFSALKPDFKLTIPSGNDLKENDERLAKEYATLLRVKRYSAPDKRE